MKHVVEFKFTFGKSPDDRLIHFECLMAKYALYNFLLSRIQYNLNDILGSSVNLTLNSHYLIRLVCNAEIE